MRLAALRLNLGAAYAGRNILIIQKFAKSRETLGIQPTCTLQLQIQQSSYILFCDTNVDEWFRKLAVPL